MDAKDLRIGNLVVLNVGQPCKCEVASLCGGNISVCPIGGGVCESFLIENGKSNGIEPIPLTEEILLNCGFEKRGLVMCCDTKYDRFYNGHFYLCSVDKKTYTVTINSDICEVKHLHELQNVFYEIKGQELEVSL